MPTLATGTRASNPRRTRAFSAGFTLVEIMIVVFIIGMIAAVAVITFGGENRDTELDKEAERLDALFDYVREQAELQTRDYGFRINTKNYQFVVFDILSNQWRLVNEDDALRERPLPEGMMPSLVVEGRQVVLPTQWPKIDDFRPQVMVFGNGDLSSFEITLQREGTVDRARLMSDEYSNIRLQLPGESEALTHAGRLQGAR
jgi:general secretion pathway protein H